jgi:hypothetical protein
MRTHRKALQSKAATKVLTPHQGVRVGEARGVCFAPLPPRVDSAVADLAVGADEAAEGLPDYGHVHIVMRHLLAEGGLDRKVLDVHEEVDFGVRKRTLHKVEKRACACLPHKREKELP